MEKVMRKLEHLDDAVLTDLVRRALEEDGVEKDITTRATVPPGVMGRAYLVSREEGVVCGLPVAEKAFALVDSSLSFVTDVKDGDKVGVDTVIAHVKGPIASILSGERVALNFLQRLSGVATKTRLYVDARAEGSRTRIMDTRKTMPTLRMLDRYAVRMGGGHNHRWNLSDAYLIKDNHIAAAGSITAAIQRAKQAHAGEAQRPWIEVEVEDLNGVREALAAGVERILLDNFNNEQVHEALEIIKGQCEVEVSGRMTLDRIWNLSRWNVDCISVGAITHSAWALDIGLDIHEHPEFDAQIGESD